MNPLKAMGFRSKYTKISMFFITEERLMTFQIKLKEDLWNMQLQLPLNTETRRDQDKLSNGKAPSSLI